MLWVFLGCSRVCVRFLEVPGGKGMGAEKGWAIFCRPPFLLLFQTLPMLGTDLGNKARDFFVGWGEGRRGGEVSLQF